MGLCGIHRFYNRKPLTGLLWLLTFGFCYVGQVVDLVLIPEMVARANRHLHSAGAGQVALPIDRQLLGLARQSGEKGFTINDAMLELDLPPHLDSLSLHQEIEKLLLAQLLDVGNDERGRVVYREP